MLENHRCTTSGWAGGGGWGMEACLLYSLGEGWCTKGALRLRPRGWLILANSSLTSCLVSCNRRRGGGGASVQTLLCRGNEVLVRCSVPPFRACEAGGEYFLIA